MTHVLAPRGHHHFIDKLAVVNGAVAGLALYPQIFVILAWGVQNNLSPLTLWLILGNNVVWMAYGIHRSLSSVRLAAILSCLAAAILLLI
ncbi:MAG: hypothetical protein JWL87_103 [Candidatus Adlerbacteria bacterium]|nr:hypothetical protein [Candidatus Adlerbacteria bacterium]